MEKRFKQIYKSLVESNFAIVLTKDKKDIEYITKKLDEEVTIKQLNLNELKSKLTSNTQEEDEIDVLYFYKDVDNSLLDFLKDNSLNDNLSLPFPLLIFINSYDRDLLSFFEKYLIDLTYHIKQDNIIKCKYFKRDQLIAVLAENVENKEPFYSFIFKDNSHYEDEFNALLEKIQREIGENLSVEIDKDRIKEQLKFLLFCINKNFDINNIAQKLDIDIGYASYLVDFLEKECIFRKIVLVYQPQNELRNRLSYYNPYLYLLNFKIIDFLLTSDEKKEFMIHLFYNYLLCSYLSLKVKNSLKYES